MIAVVKIPVLRTKVATVPTVTTSLKGRLVGGGWRAVITIRYQSQRVGDIIDQEKILHDTTMNTQLLVKIF